MHRDCEDTLKSICSLMYVIVKLNLFIKKLAKFPEAH